MAYGIFNRFKQNPQTPQVNLEDIFGPEQEENYELPENQSLRMYGEHMNAMPMRGDFKNNFLTKLAAGLVGASEGLNRGGGAGATAGREVLDRNYVNAMRDHAAQAQALKTQSDIEQEGIGQTARVMDMRERRSDRAADRKIRAFDYQDRAQDRASRATDRAEDNARRDREFIEMQKGAAADRAETARAHRENERLEGERIKAYGTGGMGRRLGPQARVPVDQYDRARQLAIEQILVEDPSAQKFFNADKDGYQSLAPEIAHDGGFFGRAGTRPLTPEEITHRDQILKRIEAAQRNVMNTMVDPYDRD